jgi:GT2 family glycosyltransferase
MSARVSVIIPNWNRAGLLDAALTCLRRQTRSADEILVVDNGSNDASIDVAAKAGARVIELRENSGFCRAVNEGIRAATGDWIVILNNDVEVGDEWLAILLDRAIARDAWFATGKLIASDRPTHLDGAWDAVCRGACAWRCGTARPDGPAWNNERPIRFAPFTAALFRAELFHRVGPLDDMFESYLEDVDFGIRCATNGYSGVYVPGATARHLGSATLGRWHKDTVRRISRNQLLLVARHFPRNWILRYGWPVLVGQALWGLLALRHGAGLAFVKGKVEGMRRFRKIRKDVGSSGSALSAILRESENEIHELQRQTGFDLYWRLYFALT